MIKAGWPFAIFLLLSGQAGAAQEDTITKLEIRTAPPEETNERLRDVIWSVFEVDDYRREATPTRPLDILFLGTAPHATNTIGLCRYDDLMVDFRQADPDAYGADAEVVPVAVSSTSHWSFFEQPEFGEDLYAEERQEDALCPDPDDGGHYFAAPNIIQAEQGYLAWIGLRRDLAEERNVPMDCVLARTDSLECNELILTLPLTALSSVERCNSSGNYATSCYVISASDRRIIVEFDALLSAADPRVTRVQLTTLIILTHERID